MPSAVYGTRSVPTTFRAEYKMVAPVAEANLNDPVVQHMRTELARLRVDHTVGQALEAIPEVLEAFLVSGDYDYYIRIAVQDTRDYERLLREKLYKIPGIRHSKSSFVLRTLKKSDTPLM